MTPRTFPPGIEGIHEAGAGQGWKITAGYAPCGEWTGSTFELPPRFYARVQKGKSAYTDYYAVTIEELNEQLFAVFGFGLSPEAVSVLEEDAATITCQ